MFHKILTTSLLLFIVIASVKSQSKVEIPLRFDKYHEYHEVVEAIKKLNSAFPQLTQTTMVGKSEEGREIWALEINNPKTGNDLEKPGIYVDGNIHGNEIQASEVCLYLANYLLTNYDKNEKIKQLVDNNAWYIIPTVNVDGRVHFMSEGNNYHNNRGLRIPKDDDHDGRFDEDFPDDLDNDKNIVQMRIRDENGQFKSHPDDERLLVRVSPGEKGEWTIIGWEGIDNDKDGLLNEDSEGFVDPNRNWGYTWQPDYIQRGAGNFPMSGTGIKAIADYIYAHQNILVAYAFHNFGGMFLRGPTTKEEGEYHKNDVKVFDFLGKNAESIVPGYRYLVSSKDLYVTYGDFGSFTDKIIGAYTFVGELHTFKDESFANEKTKNIIKKSRDDTNYERMQFNDHLTHGSLFKEWKKFNHPDFGEIELGGWVKYSTRLPHTFMLPDMVHRNASAVIFAAENTPEIKMEVFESKKISDNIYRIRLRLTNSKAIPSMSYHSIENKVFPKDVLSVKGKTVIAGGELKNRFLNQSSYKKHKPEIQFCHVPGFGTCEFEFLVEGKGKIEFEYKSVKAKNKKLEYVIK